MASRIQASAVARCLRQSRTAPRTPIYWQAARCYATAAPDTPSASSSAPPPVPEAGSAKAAPASPKIARIVDEIGGLTLLEAAELVDALKTRLNIVDIALPAASAAPAAGAGAAAGAAPEAEKAAEAPKEKTTFTITLTKIDSAQKAKVIKEVKTIMPSMNLVEAKKFVESLPKTLKDNATKDEVEKLKKALTAVGAAVEVE